MPRISVIIPAWNSEQTIARCLDSLFAQTTQDFEVIVVNDGSTDRTRDGLASYASRITIIDQENRGSNPARNRGRQASHGQFLLFLDSDIILRSDMLESLARTLEAHPEASYAYSSFRYGKKLFRLWPFDAQRLQKMPYIHTAALVRAHDFPGFDESVRRLQDWDVWLTMLRQGKRGVWVPEVLFEVTPRPDGISQWVPRWFFWIPWRLIGWKPARVRRYDEAVGLINAKHNLHKN
ncbi:glycosyltransferase family 2 protein [Candidatus Uhrbacteria bacterium]|nr:glycosyltransferase family 2 protein [Candidatus Uhrbacteria bacterium]